MPTFEAQPPAQPHSGVVVERPVRFCDGAYFEVVRPSAQRTVQRRPEPLLRALLLQAFYTVRSELQLMEQLNYNLLFRWFVGLSADDPVWDATVFCKNRDRLLDGRQSI
jgi:transposase